MCRDLKLLIFSGTWNSSLCLPNSRICLLRNYQKHINYEDLLHRDILILFSKIKRFLEAKDKAKRFLKHRHEMSYGDLGRCIILQVLRAYISTKESLRSHSVIKSIHNILNHLGFPLVLGIQHSYRPSIFHLTSMLSHLSTYA